MEEEEEKSSKKRALRSPSLSGEASGSIPTTSTTSTTAATSSSSASTAGVSSDPSPPSSAAPPLAKRVCFRQEADVKFVEKWADEEIKADRNNSAFLSSAGGENRKTQIGAGEDDWDSRYSPDEIANIRRRKKVFASGVHALGYGIDDTEVDLTNSRAAAVAASEADPEIEKDERGVIIEPFNMRREMQEGSFDEEGNYTWWRRNKDADGVHDGWLDSLDAGDSLVSFKTEEERRKVLSRMEQKDKKEGEAEEIDIATRLRTLLGILLPGETPTDALRRTKAEASRNKTVRNKRKSLSSLSSFARNRSSSTAKERSRETLSSSSSPEVRQGDRQGGSRKDVQEEEEEEKRKQKEVEGKKEEEETKNPSSETSPGNEASSKPLVSILKKSSSSPFSRSTNGEEEDEDLSFCRPRSLTRKKRKTAEGEGKGEEKKPRDSSNEQKSNETESQDTSPTEGEGEEGENMSKKEGEDEEEEEKKNGKNVDKKKDRDLEVLDAITDICSDLMTIGKNVYFLRREEIEKELRQLSSSSSSSSPTQGETSLMNETGERSSQVGEEGSSSSSMVLIPALPSSLWQFRWLKNHQQQQEEEKEKEKKEKDSSSSSLREIHGPFPVEHFQSWIYQGFISELNPVEVRQVSSSSSCVAREEKDKALGEKVDEKESPWIPWTCVNFFAATPTQSQGPNVTVEARGRKEEDDQRDDCNVKKKKVSSLQIEEEKEEEEMREQETKNDVAFDSLNGTTKTEEDTEEERKQMRKKKKRLQEKEEEELMSTASILRNDQDEEEEDEDEDEFIDPSSTEKEISKNDRVMQMLLEGERKHTRN
ncbi:cd2 antigen cytoplasmic tail-binding protein 2 [Cystoisospora suis]|uniref:Cd2 antigen cytoplasmic tail-binding protein 2 n=1 Tax=Cystoisospora suis TaxID=483139 RepID=A0A2C6KF20_9APIC|nr:cd2 antigen cytoplasmic tail-binding protein 2 [Cystoisospora suis]